MTLTKNDSTAYYFNKTKQKEQSMTDERRHCMGFMHVIEKGDTLYKLGKQYGVKVSALMFANPYINVYNLQIGDELCIPKMRPIVPPIPIDKPEINNYNDTSK